MLILYIHINPPNYKIKFYMKDIVIHAEILHLVHKAGKQFIKNLTTVYPYHEKFILSCCQ